MPPVWIAPPTSPSVSSVQVQRVPSMDLATLAQTIIVYSVLSTSPSVPSALIPMVYLPPTPSTVSPVPILTVSNVLTITPFALSVTISPI